MCLTNCSNVLIRCADGTEVLAPAAALIARQDGIYFLPFALHELARPSDTGVRHTAGATILPAMQETMTVQNSKLGGGKVVDINVHNTLHRTYVEVEQMGFQAAYPEIERRRKASSSAYIGVERRS